MLCDSNALVAMYIPQVIFGAQEGLSFTARPDTRIHIQTIRRS